MITRPFDLAAKLRPEPRTLYWLFFVNAGLLVLFFSLFGSRFVLAPGLALGGEFRLPTIAGSNAHARRPTHVIRVINGGLLYTSDGTRKMHELGAWMNAQARGTTAPILLVQASADVPMSVIADIVNIAGQSGFEVLLAAEEPPVVPKQPAR